MEVVKIPQEVLDQIKVLKSKKEYIVQEFGEIGIATEELLERKETALNYRKTLLEEESTLVEFLSSKYSNGTINSDTGEFHPLT